MWPFAQLARRRTMKNEFSSSTLCCAQHILMLINCPEMKAKAISQTLLWSSLHIAKRYTLIYDTEDDVSGPVRVLMERVALFSAKSILLLIYSQTRRNLFLSSSLLLLRQQKKGFKIQFQDSERQPIWKTVIWWARLCWAVHETWRWCWTPFPADRYRTTRRNELESVKLLIRDAWDKSYQLMTILRGFQVESSLFV